MQVQQITLSRKVLRVIFRWERGECKPSRFLWAHLLSSIKDSWRRWHAENRAVTVIQRSTLEQGPWFYPVLLHECCTAFALFVYRFAICRGGLGREQWSCGGTGFGETAQFWFNSKSVMLSEVACVGNYWSSSSSSDDCWDAFSSFSCDTEVPKKKKGGQVLAKENAFQVASTGQQPPPVIHVSAGFIKPGVPMWENKTNKKSKRRKSLKTVAAWGRARGGVSHLYWTVIHTRGESPRGILCLPFLGTLPARPKMFIHKTTRGIVSGVTLGQPFSVTNSSQACFSRR